MQFFSRNKLVVLFSLYHCYHMLWSCLVQPVWLFFRCECYDYLFDI